MATTDPPIIEGEQRPLVTVAQWLRIRTVERLQIMLDQFSAITATQQPRAEHIDQKNIHGFLLARVSELQARCDALEAQVEALQETRH